MWESWVRIAVTVIVLMTGALILLNLTPSEPGLSEIEKTAFETYQEYAQKLDAIRDAACPRKEAVAQDTGFDGTDTELK